MAGRNAWGKIGLAVAEGDRRASNGILSAASASYRKVIEGGGSRESAVSAARDTARGMGMNPATGAPYSAAKPVAKTIEAKPQHGRETTQSRDARKADAAAAHKSAKAMEEAFQAAGLAVNFGRERDAINAIREGANLLAYGKIGGKAMTAGQADAIRSSIGFSKEKLDAKLKEHNATKGAPKTIEATMPPRGTSAKPKAPEAPKKAVVLTGDLKASDSMSAARGAAPTSMRDRIRDAIAARKEAREGETFEWLQPPTPSWGTPGRSNYRPAQEGVKNPRFGPAERKMSIAGDRLDELVAQSKADAKAKMARREQERAGQGDLFGGYKAPRLTREQMKERGQAFNRASAAPPQRASGAPKRIAVKEKAFGDYRGRGLESYKSASVQFRGDTYEIRRATGFSSVNAFAKNGKVISAADVPQSIRRRADAIYEAHAARKDKAPARGADPTRLGREALHAAMRRTTGEHSSPSGLRHDAASYRRTALEHIRTARIESANHKAAKAREDAIMGAARGRRGGFEYEQAAKKAAKDRYDAIDASVKVDKAVAAAREARKQAQDLTRRAAAAEQKMPDNLRAAVGKTFTRERARAQEAKMLGGAAKRAPLPPVPKAASAAPMAAPVAKPYRAPAENPKTKRTKLGKASTVDEMQRDGNDVKRVTSASIANSNGFHVTADTSPTGRQTYGIVDAKSGYSVRRGLTKSDALALLRGGASGRTLARAAEIAEPGKASPAWGRAYQAFARYAKIVESRRTGKPPSA